MRPLIRAVIDSHALRHNLRIIRARTAGAQRKGFLEPRDRERIGHLTERESSADEAMAIGIGLDDRDDARPGRAGADDAEVVAQGVTIDDGPYKRPHRNTPSA